MSSDHHNKDTDSYNTPTLLADTVEMHLQTTLRELATASDPREVEHTATAASWYLVGLSSAGGIDSDTLDTLDKQINAAALEALKRIEAARQLSVYAQISPSFAEALHVEHPDAPAY